MSTPSTPEDVARQQLQYTKLQSQLMAQQQLWAQSQAHKSSVRWHWLLIGLGFYVLSKYILLRTSFKPVFDLFSTAKGDAVRQCFTQSEGATAWNIVLGVAYPWLPRGYPLTQPQSQFLWDAIRSGLIPSQTTIDSSFPNLGIEPLSYLCGNIFGVWAPTVGGAEAALNQIKTNPESTPWNGLLKTTSTILKDPKGLSEYLTGGFWAAAIYKGGASPKDMYDFIFDDVPDTSKDCNKTAQFAAVASNAATFSMAGAAFGPEGTAVGAGAGAVLGLGIGLFTPSGACGKPPISSCIVM
jgi:hypothetical protein